MQTLVITPDNSGNQNKILEGLCSAGLPAECIIPCTQKDIGLFLHDLSFQLMFVEIEFISPNNSFETINRIKEVNPSARIVCIVPQKDPDLMMQIMKRGIADMLFLPFSGQEVKDILNSLGGINISTAPSNSQTTKKAGDAQIIMLSSYKGGTGVSTVTANLGFCFSELDALKRKTLILDLSNQSNHCSKLLGAEATMNIEDICKNLENIGASYISSSCTWLTDNLAIIGSSLNFDSVIQGFDFERLKGAINLLAKNFAYILIDLPTHTFDARFLATVEAADQIIIVSNLDITSIWDNKNYLNVLKDLGVEQNKIRILINRYDAQVGVFKTQDLEKAFEFPISFYISNDYLGAIKAAQTQMAILESNPNSIIAEDFAELAVGLDSGAAFVPRKSTSHMAKQSSSLFKTILNKI